MSKIIDDEKKNILRVSTNLIDIKIPPELKIKKNLSDSNITFKSMRQTNREILNTELKQKITVLTKKLENIKSKIKYPLLEAGRTANIEISSNTIAICKVSTTIKIKDNMKIVFSVSSKDTEPGGLSYYLRDINETEQCFNVIVENLGDIRTIKISYMISE